MWNCIPRNNRAGLLLVLLLACTPPGCDGEKPGDTDAGASVLATSTKLTDLKGTIERRGPDGKWVAVQEGQAVALGDALRTGPGARFTMVFRDGRQMRIEGQAQLGLTGIEDELALLMEQGEVEIVANKVEGKQYRMIFSDADDMVLLREGRASLKREAGGVKIEMIMGSATIRQSGQTSPLQAGKSFVLDIGEATITGREELTTTLLDRKRQSRIRPPGASRFRRPRSRKEKLEPGTELRTRRKGSVELVDDSGNRLSLGPKSRAVFEGTFRTKKGREGVIKLDSGEANVRLRRVKSGGSTQKLVMPMGVIVANARGLTAEVTVVSRGKSTRVVVHSGTAEVAVGEKTVTLSGGQSLKIGKKGILSSPERIALPRIRAREGVRTRVFYDRKISRVGLTWKAAGQGKPVTLEVAPSADFKKPLLREPVERSSFVYQNVRPGRIFWRVTRADGQPGPLGRLEVKKDPIARQLASGKLTNVIPDTGIKTTIYFPGKVPMLTFKWDPVEGAASYRLRIYHEDDMETPVFEKTAEKTRLALPAGKLKEGTYFWYQAAWDAAGKEMVASQMNKLSLVFDNVTPLLRLEAPRPGQKPQGGQVEVRGLAPPGAKVVVGQETLSVSPDGRLQQTLSGVSKRAVLVFKLIKKGLGDVYYVRHLR